MTQANAKPNQIWLNRIFEASDRGEIKQREKDTAGQARKTDIFILIPWRERPCYCGLLTTDAALC